MTLDNYINIAGSRCLKSFIDRFGFTPVAQKEGLYLVNGPVLFHVYEHIGELYIDLYNLHERIWAWGVSSIILDVLGSEQIAGYLVKHERADENLTFLPPKSAQELLATIDILETRFQDLLMGDLTKYKKFFHPISEQKIEELKQIVEQR